MMRRSDIVLKMTEIADKADELYKTCLYEGVSADTLPDPNTWLLNEQVMRDVLKNKVRLFFKDLDEDDNVLLEYLNFMNDSYPVDFGTKLRENYEKGIRTDGAVLYYELSYPVRTDCGYCDNPDCRLLCANCQIVSYCDRDCQSSHWLVHKKQCTKFYKLIKK